MKKARSVEAAGLGGTVCGIGGCREVVASYDGTPQLQPKVDFMKIISLNREFTLDTRNLAFNLDEEPTKELIDLVEYGYLTLTWSGKVLKVSIPENESDYLNADNVKSLQDIIQEAEEEIQKAKDKRQKMLERIAKQTGLSLD